MDAGFTVLIVDDDRAVRDVLVRILREKALRVFAATNGYEALRIVGEHPVDLLLADIVMPVMDGVQLAAQAKLLRPGIKVLFATGYAQRAMERKAMRFGKVIFKPFRQPELIQEIDALLGAAI